MMLVNGTRSDQVPAQDRGLHYGDGVFETMAVCDGRIRLLDRHLQRLHRSLQVLKIESPPGSILHQELNTVATQLHHGVLKLIVTRGAGGRGYAPPENGNTTRVISTYPWPELRDETWLRVCMTRLGAAPQLGGIKHLNRLEQVLARLEWSDSEQADDGLMLDSRGRVIETTRANVFAVRRGTLCTPPVDVCGVSGVMRDWVMELSREHAIPVVEESMLLADLEQAEEIFVTNAIAGITPVARLQDRLLSAGTVTRRLMKILADSFEHHV